ncbi:MAG: hypothetical protein Q8N03_08905 [Ignavibacteria bacterium]|nr:hypothetical protein [Ignavibacteria bacterium]
MIIRKVKTEIFQKEFETRGSYPSLFDCSDENRYIVKHAQQGRNNKHLINELIAAQLAQTLNIPIPEFSLIEINESILPVDYLFACGKPSGLGYGSQYLPGTLRAITNIDTIINITKFKNFEVVEDLIKICAFDIWLRNADRVINNPNLLLQESGKRIRLFAIDHSSIFSELNYNDLERELSEIPAIGENLVDAVLFQKLYFKYGLFFDKVKQDICTAISALTDKSIYRIVDNIPLEWRINSEEKDAIFNFINTRKYLVKKQFDILLKEIGL